MNATHALWTLMGTAGVLALAATLVLWARHGEAIFVETILSGIAGCFG